MPKTFNLLAATHQGFFYPVQASEIAKLVDPLAWFIHGISILFTVGIVGVTLYFVWKYRSSVHPIAQPPGHNNVLEVVWTAIPAVIVFVCFFWGFRVYMKMTVPQPGAYKVEAVGKQWVWLFSYDNPKGGPRVQTEDMYLVVDKPVEIDLRSDDVIHALYLPAMRMKKDVVPGRFNTMFIQPNRLGDYDIYCAEYCGDSHSQMHRKCHVLTQAGFDEQMAIAADPEIDPKDKTKKLPAALVGFKIASLNGCFSCHSSDGSAGTGPTWKDMYGATGHEMADGTSVTVDAAYVHESIRTPNAKVRKGFGPPSPMNPFPPTQVSDKYIDFIIEYQKSISKFAPATDAPKQDGPSGGSNQTAPQTSPPVAGSADNDGTKTAPK